MCRGRCVSVFCAVIAVFISSEQISLSDSHSFFEMPLEELLKVEVVSVSKKKEEMKDVDSAVYVITSDDIRRSGSTHLLDVLKMVPGVWMQEVSRNVQSFGVRGRIDEYPVSVRVLLDGVPIWSPVTGGPMFQYLNVPVESIDRIEVIKGPGGTIYGANANTGVINIYTRDAEKSQGGKVKIHAGTQDYFSPFVSFGGRLSDKVLLSGYINYLTTSGYDKTDAFRGDVLNVTAADGSVVQVNNRFPRHDVDGQEAFNANIQLRADLSDKLRSTSRFFLSAVNRDAYTLLKVPNVVRVQGDDALDYFLSERLDFDFAENHQAFIHAYYRQQDVDVANDGGFKSRTTVFEVELQDNLAIGFNKLSFGVNYSTVKFGHENGDGSDMTYLDVKGREQLYGAFIQDTIPLSSMVDITAGLKAETWTLVDNEVELSPSVRLAFKPDDDLILWGAVSRTVTTPGYFHQHLEHRVADAAGDGSAFVAIVPTESIKHIDYTTFEAGLRTTKIPKTYADFSVFYSKIDDYIGLDADFQSKPMVASRVGDYAILPMYFTNTAENENWGGEALVRIKPSKNISLELSYSALFMDSEGLDVPGQPGVKFSPVKERPRVTPEHIVRLRKYVDIPEVDVSLMLGLMWASESWRGIGYDNVTQLPDDVNGTVPDEPDDLIKVDFNIEKRFGKNISFNIWGRNIFADDYVEFYSQYVASGYPHTVHRTFGCSLGFDF